MPAKIIHAPNLARSAMAPETRATVMMANVAWNATKASGGYAAPSGVSSTPARLKFEGSMAQANWVVPASVVGNAIE
jgi:hypothetical protein